MMQVKTATQKHFLDPRMKLIIPLQHHKIICVPTQNFRVLMVNLILITELSNYQNTLKYNLFFLKTHVLKNKSIALSSTISIDIFIQKSHNNYSSGKHVSLLHLIFTTKCISFWCSFNKSAKCGRFQTLSNLSNTGRQ